MTKKCIVHFSRRLIRSLYLPSVCLALTMPAAVLAPAEAQTWRGLVVAEEHRCSPYDKDDYRYSQQVEQRIIDENLDGRIYSPYTNQYFGNKRETDIEHIVARSEAHDSGLCASTPERRHYFSEDPLNLTLANPRLNRQEKKDKDAASWAPKEHRCWFAHTVVEVRLRYGLTIDEDEKNALDMILKGCSKKSFGIVFAPHREDTGPSSP